MAKTVIVTGGAGYIGSHACKALAKAGFVPVVYDNLSLGFEESVLYGPLEIGDVRDEVRFAEVMAKHKPVAVMHFAALIAVGDSVKDPAAYYETNTLGAWKVLEAVRRAGVPFVFSSTAAVYGIPESSPVREDALLSPINPYGQSKLAVERMMADYGAAYGLKFAALRYFNACGADVEGEIGLRNVNPPHLIPSALEVLMGTRPALRVFGTDYPTADGTAVRDYIHVTDLAEAHVAALDYLLKGGESAILNLGSGRGYSVQEIVEAVETATGKDLAVVKEARRAGDPPVLVADCAKAKDLLGWAPKYSDLATIVRTGWAWRQKLA
jgi:UDP-glucose-4-epimerase GalE